MKKKKESKAKALRLGFWGKEVLIVNWGFFVS